MLQTLADSTNSRHFDPSAWVYRHEEVYREVLQASLTDGVTDVEKKWLDAIAGGLKIRDQHTLNVEAVRTALWQLMSDQWVTEEESAHAIQLIESLGLKREDLVDELMVMDQFVQGRKVHESGLPVISVEIALQRNEVCHHRTYGEFLEKKVLRSYTRGGQRLKEEGLERVKEGDIYITSKRILLVSSGTSSIPHEKILDIEIDVDERLIEITKDGRQKPIYIQVRDAIYSGMLIEILSRHDSAHDHEAAS